MIILPLLSFGAIYALIPIIIIIILIAAAAGLSRGADLFALLGFGALVEAASGIGKVGGGFGVGSIGSGKGIAIQNRYKGTGGATAGMVKSSTVKVKDIQSQTPAAPSTGAQGPASSAGTSGTANGGTGGTTSGTSTGGATRAGEGLTIGTGGGAAGGAFSNTGGGSAPPPPASAARMVNMSVNGRGQTAGGKAKYGRFTLFSKEYAKENLGGKLSDFSVAGGAALGAAMGARRAGTTTAKRIYRDWKNVKNIPGWYLGKSARSAYSTGGKGGAAKVAGSSLAGAWRQSRERERRRAEQAKKGAEKEG